MRRVLLLITLAGCASASTTTTARPAAIYQSAETGTLMAEAPRGETTAIAAPPAAVWAAVKATYEKLGVPITLENPAAHQIGNQSFAKMRQLGGRPMADYVDCGLGMDGPKASYYRITAALVTDVTAAASGGTQIHTIFDPTGQDVGGNSTDRLHCASTGRLEALIAASVQSAVAKR